ncbi:MAG TPA: hypothetical protein VFB72_17450 [Verrucomicrobiae bacterium]|nr:hypothetical protein [Verrucomicrobiae bacterium]
MSLNRERQPWWETKQIKLVVVVFAVIGTFVLAPYALESMRGPARIAQAKREVADLAAAINCISPITPGFLVLKVYSRISRQILYSAPLERAPQRSASRILPALRKTNFGNGNLTPNTNDALNPQKIVFLNARMSGHTNSPGIGTDGVYRDPWGNPYIISFVRPATIRVWSLGPDVKRTNECYITSW